MPGTQYLLDTYQAICLLAKVYRHNNVTFDTNRRENVAEHSYSLAVLATALAYDMNQGTGQPLDVGKVTHFAVVHDLIEAYMKEGDISVYAPAELLNSKKESEKAALDRLEGKVRHTWITETIKEYERQTTAEARFVYALDKMIVQKINICPTHAAYIKI